MNNEITVLMAVHKGERADYLHEALESLHRQTLQPAKIVLVEDGPLSRGLSECIRYWQMSWRERLLRIRNPQNMGLTTSLNRGIEFISTPLIARMDSDDRSHPRRFEWQAKFLRHHPEIAVVGGSICEFDELGTHTATHHYPLTHEAALRTIHRASPLAHPTVMMRSEIFRSGIRYNERYRTSQDIALWFDLICNGYRIANIRQTVLYFRVGDGLYSRRSRDKAWSEFRIYCNGIRRLNGLISLRYVWPLGRLCTRLMPTNVIRWLYQSNLRQRLSQP